MLDDDRSGKRVQDKGKPKVAIYHHTPNSLEFNGKTPREIEGVYAAMFTPHMMGLIASKTKDTIGFNLLFRKIEFIVNNNIIGYARNEQGYQDNPGEIIVRTANLFMKSFAQKLKLQGDESVISDYSAGFVDARVNKLVDILFAEEVNTADRLDAASAINKALKIEEKEETTRGYVNDKDAFNLKLKNKFKDSYDHLQEYDLERLLESKIDEYTAGFLVPRVARFMDALFAEGVSTADRLDAAKAINKALKIVEDEENTKTYVDDRIAFSENLSEKIQNNKQLKPDKLRDLFKAAIEQSPDLPESNPLRSYKAYTNHLGATVLAVGISQDKAV